MLVSAGDGGVDLDQLSSGRIDADLYLTACSFEFSSGLFPWPEACQQARQEIPFTARTADERPS